MWINKDEHITGPTLMVNAAIVKSNLLWMMHKAKTNKVVLRPHFKTPQNLQIAQLIFDLGIRHITVSSVAMAFQLANIAWKDITIAFPFNLREIDQINRLAKKQNINLLVENQKSVEFLIANVDFPLGVFIKVDAGYHRTGIASDNEQEIGSVIRSINSSNKLKFKGLLSHFGNSYHVNRREEVREIYSSSLKSLLNLQAKLNAEFGVIPLSVGDTPSMSIMNEYGAVDEIRPGNFMYFDWMQYKIGSCSLDQIAAIMLCPIVAKHPERLELIIHGGAVHFSKEYLETTNGKNYGQVVKINENGQLEITEGTHLVSLSQEHGSIQCTKESFSKFAIGELVAVIPIHSCLTANLMKENTIIVNG